MAQAARRTRKTRFASGRKGEAHRNHLSLITLTDLTYQNGHKRLPNGAVKTVIDGITEEINLTKVRFNKFRKGFVFPA